MQPPMTLTVTLKEDDYLTYQLYNASKNKRTKNNRIKSWLIISGTFFLLSLLFINGDKFYCYYFLGAGLVCLAFYPFYQRTKYRKHYQKFVLENNRSNFGRETEITFTPEYIFSKNITAESKVNTGEVVKIDEIGTHYFIKVKSEQSLIIPKSIHNDDLFVPQITAIFNSPDITISKELNWKWK